MAEQRPRRSQTAQRDALIEIDLLEGELRMLTGTVERLDMQQGKRLERLERILQGDNGRAIGLAEEMRAHGRWQTQVMGTLTDLETVTRAIPTLEQGQKTLLRLWQPFEHAEEDLKDWRRTRENWRRFKWLVISTLVVAGLGGATAGIGTLLKRAGASQAQIEGVNKTAAAHQAQIESVNWRMQQIQEENTKLKELLQRYGMAPQDQPPPPLRRDWPQ